MKYLASASERVENSTHKGVGTSRQPVEMKNKEVETVSKRRGSNIWITLFAAVYFMGFCDFEQHCLLGQETTPAGSVPAGSVSVTVTAFDFESRVLSSPRQCWVHLPADYYSPKSKDKMYPVLYVLDGQRLTLPISSIVDYYSQRGVHSQLPEMIVVGITSEDRGAEFTPTSVPLEKQPFPFQIKNSGQCQTFEKFLSEELVPYIDQEFRTASCRLLLGHSLGGLFVMQQSCREQSPFDAFVALDPSLWWDKENLLPSFGLQWKQLQKHRQLFIARVSYPQDDAHHALETSPVEISSQADAAKEQIDVTVCTLDGLDHGSCVIPGAQRGLFKVFELFHMNVREVANNPEQLNLHFQKYSDRMGYIARPSPEILQWLIQFSLRNGNQNASDAFQKMLDGQSKGSGD